MRPPAWIEGGGWRHPLETGQLGCDLLSRVVVGARVSLLVGHATVAVGLTVGATLGTVAGYVGGALEPLVKRLVELQLSFPYILPTLAVIAVFGPGLLTVVLGLSSWTAYARMARSNILSVKRRDCSAGAIALGGSGTRVWDRHVGPHIANALVILATLEVSQMMMADAALNFLGDALSDRLG